ncbi:exodeoxyribonuclease 7 small subunit [Sporosarcina sp. NCCP-2716]|uniref:exodeoxyribonuclease VII small subunit n=1 Tax=Sporosarcina sp. NCCP-2716 TaxID=2943679 RepID=UPI00203C1D4B|nr:exodeoxyribonuclease VII small subunit [Sporosarcina sp. NCCP-2716]GKV68120.1 exodeoxyribonuclease 7 small subunit [Sporosarcina sp. NCCP-2716]
METDSMKFEEAMMQLEKIVQQLETGDVPLEDSITLYKQGMELSAFCQQKLQHAEKQLITIVDNTDAAAQFDPSKGENAGE